MVTIALQTRLSARFRERFSGKNPVVLKNRRCQPPANTVGHPRTNWQRMLLLYLQSAAYQ